MDGEKAKHQDQCPQFHKEVRVQRAFIICGKRIRQIQPAEFKSLQVVANYANADFSDLMALMQKHAGLSRMSALCAKSMRLSNPATEFCIGYNSQMADPVPTNRCTSQPAGGEVGKSCYSNFGISF